jgi:hypothetical protein
VLEPGALEEYDASDFSGRVVHLRERILYSFYATPGLFIGRLQHGITGLAVYYGNGNDFEAEEHDPGFPDPPAPFRCSSIAYGETRSSAASEVEAAKGLQSRRGFGLSSGPGT